MIDLRTLVSSAMTQFAPLAEAKRLELSFAGVDQAYVVGDSESVSVMLHNLLDNAIKYTPEGGKIAISLFDNSGNPTLQIEDTGNGIPMNERERVFDRFYRMTGNSTTGAGLGTGHRKIHSGRTFRNPGTS